MAQVSYIINSKFACHMLAFLKSESYNQWLLKGDELQYIKKILNYTQRERKSN